MTSKFLTFNISSNSSSSSSRRCRSRSRSRSSRRSSSTAPGSFLPQASSPSHPTDYVANCIGLHRVSQTPVPSAQTILVYCLATMPVDGEKPGRVQLHGSRHLSVVCGESVARARVMGRGRGRGKEYWLESARFSPKHQSLRHCQGLALMRWRILPTRCGQGLDLGPIGSTCVAVTPTSLQVPCHLHFSSPYKCRATNIHYAYV